MTTTMTMTLKKMKKRVTIMEKEKRGATREERQEWVDEEAEEEVEVVIVTVREGRSTAATTNVTGGREKGMMHVKRRGERDEVAIINDLLLLLYGLNLIFLFEIFFCKV